MILTHRNLVANMQQLRSVSMIDPGVRTLAVLPFSHIYGMTCLLNQGIDRRATVVTLPRFDLAQFLAAIAEHQVQRVCIVPPIAVALAKHPAVDSYDLSSLDAVFSGAAPLDAELGHALARRLGCRVTQGYGMTELSPVSHCAPDGVDLDIATVGRLLPNMEAMIVDPATGAELPPGEPGELWCRGPNVMAGYLNDPDGHRRPRSTGTAGCTPGDLVTRRRGWRVHGRRPDQGTDQVQGLVGGARRAGGRAAHP